MLEKIKKYIKSDRELAYVEHRDIAKVMGGIEYEEFSEWMTGQTSYIDGIYLHDIENFYRNKRNGTLDNLPWGF